ncbi:unnamed protein product [Caenorhabditis brenneri]
MCFVCGSPEAEPHFGGISCRNCAAFFRRYFHSGKVSKVCTCQTRCLNAHPCRKCRIEKCFKVGMTPERIQVSRDKHSPKISKDHNSLLVARIISRDTPNLQYAIPNWRAFEMRREELKGGNIGNLNVFELTSTVRTDIELTWRMVSKMFPLTEKLQERDRSALLRNFILKLWQIEPILACADQVEEFESTSDEEKDHMIISFYQGTFPEGEEMSEKEILRTFSPIWWYYYHKMMVPIIRLRLQNEEWMAIIWLLFFDYGYTNISSECQEMCRTMRKMIYLELKNYQKSREFDEMRFIETVETLEIIERGEKKFMEEMMICEMSNIKIHDDFREILRENKF